MAAANWFVECQRYFIETGERNRKGNAVKIPISIRKMHLSGEFIITDYYRVTFVKRKSGNFYSVKLRQKPKRAWWDKTPLKDSDYKMVKDASYNREQFIKWLKPFVANPEGACVELENCSPAMAA